MAEEIREVLNLLNEKLAGVFPYRLELMATGELRLLEKNARYMKPEQFQNLVENVKKDGNLSSLPLCYREKDGKLRVLSGNHRVMAAKQAGVEQVLVMVVADEKDVDQRLAIQLSHNAIAGQDDLVLLKELWESIKDVQVRVYAGLDSETVKALQGIQFAAISEQRLRYKLANFLFLPEELEDLDQLLKETALAFAGDAVYLAHLNTYDALFELITRIKKRCQIKNSAAAALGLPEEIRTAKPSTDTYSLAQGQDEFFCALPHEQMDIVLFGMNHGYPVEQVAAEAGLNVEQVERVYRDIRNKRRTTQALHRRPILMEPIPEIEERRE